MELIITLQDQKYHRIEPESVCVPIELDFMRPAFRKVDHPLSYGKIINTVLCTPSQEIVATEKDRKQIAKIVADHVEAFLLTQFEKSDTTMGYRNIPEN